MLDEIMKWLGFLPPDEKEREETPKIAANKQWVCNIPASYVDPNTKEKWLSWHFILFKTGDKKSVELSLPKDHYHVKYGALWSHPQYVDLIIPWLHSNNVGILYSHCSSWNRAFDGVEIITDKVPAPVTPEPKNKTSATILKLVKNETEDEETEP